jgi:phage terminase small subunit
MADKLTAKQEMFIKEYLIDLNATQAAKRAGYSDKNAFKIGSELLQKTTIQTALQKAMNKRAAKVDISAEYVLSTIHETVERCRQSYPVLDRRGQQVYVETPDGDMLPAYEFDAKDVLKGCELLGKHLGMFVDKSQVKITHDFEDMSDEELLRSIRRMEKELTRDGDKSQR